MRDASGESIPLVHGRFAAEIVTVGACLRSLTADGLDLVAGWPAGQMCPSSRGAVLMPWPNRIADGAYDFDGAHFQLALTEPAKHNALHGLAHWVPWTVAVRTTDRVVLRYELPPQTGYPFALDLQVDYRLDDDGLTATLTATNAGDRPAPYGTGLHPYLTVGRRVDDCVLTLPAQTWCAMSERGHASPAEPVAGTPYDFREPRPVGGLVLDHPFGGVADGATASLADPDSGREVSITVHGGIGWLHVFTGDTIAGRERESLAIEPVTCPPDAFNSGVDLVVLEPGAAHRVSFTITGS